MTYYSKNKVPCLFRQNTSLTFLANEFETDKGDADRNTLSWASRFPTHHTNGYTNTYEKYMTDRRSDDIKFLEIGICDQRFPLASIKLWLSYFQNIDLYCVDNFWGSPPSSETIASIQNMGANIFIADQGSSSDWDEIEKIVETNSLDFIVEDGSHYPNHMLFTLWRSINLLKSNAYYFMEDIQDPKTTGGMYGFDNTSVYHTVLNFMQNGVFSHELLTQEQCKDIEQSFRIVEIHVGGPKHCQVVMAVFQKL